MQLPFSYQFQTYPSKPYSKNVKMNARESDISNQPFSQQNQAQGTCEGKLLSVIMGYADTNVTRQGIDLRDVFIPSAGVPKGRPRLFSGNFKSKSELAHQIPSSTTDLTQKGDHAEALFNVSMPCNTLDKNGAPAMALTLDYEGGNDGSLYPFTLSNKGTKVQMEGVSIKDLQTIEQVLHANSIKTVGTRLDEIVLELTEKKIGTSNDLNVTAKDVRIALQEYYDRLKSQTATSTVNAVTPQILTSSPTIQTTPTPDTRVPEIEGTVAAISTKSAQTEQENNRLKTQIAQNKTPQIVVVTASHATVNTVVSLPPNALNPVNVTPAPPQAAKPTTAISAECEITAVIPNKTKVRNGDKITYNITTTPGCEGASALVHFEEVDLFFNDDAGTIDGGKIVNGKANPEYTAIFQHQIFEGGVEEYQATAFVMGKSKQAATIEVRAWYMPDVVPNWFGVGAELTLAVGAVCMVDWAAKKTVGGGIRYGLSYPLRRWRRAHP